MGNLTTKHTPDLQLIINATKHDIRQTYDLSNSEEVAKANEELMRAFSTFTCADISLVKKQFFACFPIQLPENPTISQIEMYYKNI